MIAFCFNW